MLIFLSFPVVKQLVKICYQETGRYNYYFISFRIASVTFIIFLGSRCKTITSPCIAIFLFTGLFVYK